MLQYDHCQHAGPKLVEFRCADSSLHWLGILQVFEELATREIHLKYPEAASHSSMLIDSPPYLR